ncbi:MAG TPA: aminotransferase class IV [Beijerinckiaceae bacterium]|nr:aminotransferase class IV [Beijerinckiaceae bacterium]
MNVIDSKSLERDAGEKPVPTFSHPALAEFAADFGAAHKRVRLVLFRGMALEMSASPLSASPPSSYRVAIAEPRHQSDELLLRHKTTLRDRYERPLAAAAAAVEADEILFLNERDELCEGARCNVFVMREGQLLTPPLSCGLLPGTLRARLLHQGHAREAMLGLADITPATQWFMGNSVRGLVPAALVAS